MTDGKTDEPARFTTPLPALILQRLGAAAAGFRPQRDHWILVAADGGSVRRVEKAADATDPPRERPGEHAFAVAGTGEAMPRRARIVGMRVDIEAIDGSVRRDIAVPVENLDALFFGEGAIDRFVVPYYCAAFSTEYGMRLKAKWSDDPSIAAFCHTPWSEDCSFDDNGEQARGTMNLP